jgi:hypothetical protein
MTNPDQTPPMALLLIAPGCPHCPGVLKALSELLKEGVIGTMEVVNIAAHPERAQALGVRSVPWTRIGPFELEGGHSIGELRQWAERATDDSGISNYYSHLLENRKLERVVAAVKNKPESLESLLNLLPSEETPMAVRIGISAVMEELEGSESLSAALPRLTELTRSPDANIRGDACHYLGLTHNGDARSLLQSMLDDENADVREIAQDALDTLGSEGVVH